MRQTTLPRSARIVVAAGLTGAVTLAAYLCVVLTTVFRTSTPQALLQWFASNVIGVAAFRGGWSSAAVGFLLHCLVSIAWAGVYVTVASRTRWIWDRPILAGVLFGLFVMCAMVYIVVPLDQAPKSSYTLLEYANNVVATTIFFGVPVALVVSRLWKHPAGER